MIFKESQTFAPWVLWGMRAGLGIIGAVFIYIHIAFGVSALLLALIFVVTIVPPMLLLEVVKLKTVIDPQGIDIKLWPFTKKTFAWDDVESAEMIDYGFVGGWGIRMTLKYGTVYNAQGSEGLLLKLKNGKKRVIGTQRRAAMQAAVKTHFGA